MKYRKKPVVIEAILFRGPEDKHLVREFVTTPMYLVNTIDEVGGLYLETREGWMHVSPGDYIIKGVEGEFYPCKPDIFDATYDPVAKKGTHAL